MTSKGKSGGSGGPSKAKSHSPVSGKARLVRGNGRLWLQINRTWYWIERLEGDVIAAWTLLKAGSNSSYVVALHPDRSVTCECQDYLFRRAGKDPKGCRHIAALRAVGLLETPR